MRVAWRALGAVLVIVVVCPLVSAQSKEQMYSEMLALADQMRALKPLLQTSPEAVAHYAALEARYQGLSDQMGGDDPAQVFAGSGQRFEPQGRVATGEPPPPPPPGCQLTSSFFTNNTPVPIPTGPAVVSSQIVVAGIGPYLWDLNLLTTITHTFNADLDITLQSPAGTVVTLTTDNGGSNDNVFNGTFWDDDADPDGQVPYTSNDGLVTDSTYANLVVETPLVPEEAFAAFIGEDPNGTWTLTISDDTAGDGGSLNNWTLAIAHFPVTPVTASTTALNNTPVPIPSGPAVVSSQLAVAGADTFLCDLNLTTFIQHTFASDLDITLLSPAGTIMTLTTDNGGGNDNVFNGTFWDDDADPDGQVPYSSNDGLVTDSTYANLVVETPLVPEEAFGAFIGEDPNGTWTLTISDDLGGDGGSLDSWGLDLTTCLCGMPVLTIDKIVDNQGPVLSGDILTYTITVQNTGNAPATNVVVLDPVPTMTTYVANSCTTTQGSCSLNGPNVEFLLGTMNPQTMATLTFQVQVDPPPLPPGTIVNQNYTVASDQTAPVAGAPVTVVLVPAELMEFESAAGNR